VGWPWKWIYANLIVANPVIAMPRMVGHVSPVESASHMPNRRTDKSETIGSDHLGLNPQTRNGEQCDPTDRHPFELRWWKPTINPYDCALRNYRNSTISMHYLHYFSPVNQLIQKLSFFQCLFISYFEGLRHG
jgi:hypothetical protein